MISPPRLSLSYRAHYNNNNNNNHHTFFGSKKHRARKPTRTQPKQYNTNRINIHTYYLLLYRNQWLDNDDDEQGVRVSQTHRKEIKNYLITFLIVYENNSIFFNFAF